VAGPHRSSIYAGCGARASGDAEKPAVVVEVRPYTAQDWERDNAGRVYESTLEMDAALDEYCALPDLKSA
jgi:hypothetical protein